MGRQKAFDPERALASAMRHFWAHGFHGSSMRDLTDCMGIAGPSLYNAFGNKEALFEKALDHYSQLITHRFLQGIEDDFPADDRIAELFAEVVDRSVNDVERRGCFLINSALDVAPHDPHLREVITQHLNRVRSFFQRSLESTGRSEQAVIAISPSETAEHLLTVLLGIRMLARSSADVTRLNGAAASALASIGLADSWERRRRRSRSARKRCRQAV